MNNRHGSHSVEWPLISSLVQRWGHQSSKGVFSIIYDVIYNTIITIQYICVLWATFLWWSLHNTATLQMYTLTLEMCHLVNRSAGSNVFIINYIQFNNIDKSSNILYHTRHQSNSITLRIQQQLFPSSLYLAVVFSNTYKTQTVLRLSTWLYENKNVHYGTIKYNYLNTAFSPVYTIDSFITQTPLHFT